MVLRGQDFGKCLGPEGRALVNGIPVLIKDFTEPPPLPPPEDRSEKQRSMNLEAGSHLTPNLPPPGSWTSKFAEL